MTSFKVCTKCKENKAITEFSKDKHSKAGYTSACKKCRAEQSKIWALKNQDKVMRGRDRHKHKVSEYCKRWREKHPEKQKESNRKQYYKDPGYHKARKAVWLEKNPDYYKNHYKNNKKQYLANCRAYQTRKLQRTPKWVDLKTITQIYENCPQGMHVDHIIPLNGTDVSGLHVPWNLQYLTPEENLRKSNKLILPE